MAGGIREMEIRVIMTMEAPSWEKPKLIGGVVIQSGMSVLQLKRMMEHASHLVEQRLVEEGLLGVLHEPRL